MSGTSGMSGDMSGPPHSPAGGRWLWRMPAGAKLVVLAATGTVAFLITSLPALAGFLAAVAALWLLAGVGVRALARELKRLFWVAAVIFAVQALLGDWRLGLALVLRLAALILLASLVTATTRTTAMIAALERGLRPLAFFGLSPARLSLAIAMAFRFVPLIGDIVAEVREAQKVRGLERSLLAIAVPVIVRSLKLADTMAEAIDARGFDPAAESPRRGKTDRSPL